jgi:hypothetical protein
MTSQPRANPDVLVDTDVLVVGTGPAGSAAGALLATYGVDTTVINKFGWTARTPRAHITNQRTMEILRDLRLEQEAVRAATPRELMGQNTYCTSLAGQELGRIRTWGTHPAWMAQHDVASPTRMCDLPQNMLEPITSSVPRPPAHPQDRDRLPRPGRLPGAGGSCRRPCLGVPALVIFMFMGVPDEEASLVKVRRSTE